MPSSRAQRGLPGGAPATWGICFFLLTLTIARSATGQGVGAVPPDDPVYRIIDRLDAAGLLDTLVRGQRPYSRREVLRLLSAARGYPDARPPVASLGSGQAPRSGGSAQGHPDARVASGGSALPGFPRTRILLESVAEVEQRFAENAWSALDEIDLAVTSTSATPRFIPADPGIGEVDALIAPLAVRAQPGGRNALLQTTFALESRHHLPLGTHLAVDVQPRVRMATKLSFVAEDAIALQTASLSGRLANVDAAIGREHLEWGQGRSAGLALSATAPPLDLIRISTDHPWVLPGWLRVVGPSVLSFFVADLGPTQYFPHTRLAAYKWSAKPTRNLEIGAGALDFVGGQGAPKASVGKQVANLFLFPILPTEGYQFSNTVANLEARLKLSRLGGAQVYWELALDDFDYRRFGSSVWTDDAAHLFGLELPGLARQSGTSVTIEVHHTGTRFGRHLQFQSGMATKHFLLGDPLGPNAFAQYAFLDRDIGRRSSVSLELAHETYASDQHALSEHPFRIRVIERRPREDRQRAMVTFRRDALARGVGVGLHAGIERTEHFAFAPSDTRVAALGSVSVNYVFR